MVKTNNTKKIQSSGGTIPDNASIPDTFTLSEPQINDVHQLTDVSDNKESLESMRAELESTIANNEKLIETVRQYASELETMKGMESEIKKLLQHIKTLERDMRHMSRENTQITTINDSLRDSNRCLLVELTELKSSESGKRSETTETTEITEPIETTERHLFFKCTDVILQIQLICIGIVLMFFFFMEMVVAFMRPNTLYPVTYTIIMNEATLMFTNFMTPYVAWYREHVVPIVYPLVAKLYVYLTPILEQFINFIHSDGVVAMRVFLNQSMENCIHWLTTFVNNCEHHLQVLGIK